MKNEENILPKLPKTDGMTVPEGYFADFNRRMVEMLPERPELDEADKAPLPRTWWERVRPYTYMAAMFAGVWCMLKLFTMLTATSPQPLETNPVIAEAFNNDVFVNEYVIPDVNQWDLYDDMMEEGIPADILIDSIGAFEADPDAHYQLPTDSTHD